MVEGIEPINIREKGSKEDIADHEVDSWQENLTNDILKESLDRHETDRKVTDSQGGGLISSQGQGTIV